MSRIEAFHSGAAAWLTEHTPERPVMFFEPGILQATAARFLKGFPGMVTYAVKANPAPGVLDNLLAAGVAGFDVASPDEMALVRDRAPEAALHYHNPVRTRAEIAAGLEAGVTSWSVDRHGELEKLSVLPKGSEVAVRLKLEVAGAAYDFGTKFGAGPERAADLLRRVVEMGFTPSLTFHPGTQCDSAMPWRRYIQAAAEVAQAAGVSLHRLNVGGGFAARRGAAVPDLEGVFAAIAEEVAARFGADAPALVCEPGRGMVAECMTLALQVKAVEDEVIFLNDGLYGSLAEWRDIAASDRISVVSPEGLQREAAARRRVAFGPTCDSLDVLPEPLALPGDLAEGDYLLFAGMGAYSGALATGFNGYGMARTVTLGPTGQ